MRYTFNRVLCRQTSPPHQAEKARERHKLLMPRLATRTPQNPPHHSNKTRNMLCFFAIAQEFLLWEPSMIICFWALLHRHLYPLVRMVSTFLKFAITRFLEQESNCGHFFFWCWQWPAGWLSSQTTWLKVKTLCNLTKPNPICVWPVAWDFGRSQRDRCSLAPTKTGALWLKRSSAKAPLLEKNN